MLSQALRKEFEANCERFGLNLSERVERNHLLNSLNELCLQKRKKKASNSNFDRKAMEGYFLVQVQVSNLFSKITDKFYNEHCTRITMLIKACSVI